MQTRMTALCGSTPITPICRELPRHLRTGVLPIAVLAALVVLHTFTAAAAQPTPSQKSLRIGWASVCITPDQPVVLTGQSWARLSEGTKDPVTATALALESPTGEGVILISCDLVSIPDDFRDRIRALVEERLAGHGSPYVVINGTHTHSAPEIRHISGLPEKLGVDISEDWSRWGVEFDAISPPAYIEFATARIAEAATAAWNAREPGGVSFGFDYAVVGHNRIMAYADGSSEMYGSRRREDFTHVEGWEDHALQLVCTWNREETLTGVVINLATPIQHETGANYELTADFVHDVREMLRKRLGKDLYVMAQCSAAGDQIARVQIHRRAAARMEQITGQSARERLATEIGRTVASILPHMPDHIDWNPVFAHRLETVELPAQALTGQDYEGAIRAFEARRDRYLTMRAEIEANPEMRNEARWYVDVTRTYAAMRGASARMEQFESQAENPTRLAEVYVLRLGDIVFATNPFELYLDFGVRIQERSPAVQTFLVQLTGSGSYLAPERSVAGGAYGARAGNSVGGAELVEQTLALIDALWPEDAE